jgi:hypothetical protein
MEPEGSLPHSQDSGTCVYQSSPLLPVLWFPELWRMRESCKYICLAIVNVSRSQWPCGLRRGSSAARLLGSWVRIPPRTWMSVSCECCVLSGRGLCDGLVTRTEESYRVWCVWVWSWSLECCVLSGRGLCDGLVTLPEESYRVWCVWVWSWSLDNEEA